MTLTQLPPYNAYKPSGVEWLGDIPEHWEVYKVKQVFSLIIDPAPMNNRHELLSIYTDIGVKPRKELEEKGNKASTTDGYWQVKKGDFIVNKLLAWMGAVGISDYDGVTSPAYDILRPKRKIEGYFYHYLFRTPVFISEMKKNSRGIMDMRLRLYFDKLGDIRIPLPSIEEQTAIATFLDQKTALIDEAITIKEQQITLLKERKQIIIQQAVTKGLDPTVPMKDSGIEWIGEIPEHWEVKKLKFSTFINEKTLTENTPKNYSLQYVDIGSVTYENGIEKIEYFSFGEAPSRARRLANKGDTIVSTVRTYLKAITFIDEKSCNYIYSTGFAVIRPSNKLYSKFVTSYIKSNAFTYQVDSVAKGMSYPAINSTDLSNLYIVQPILSEQTAIVDHIETQTTKIDEAITLQQQQIDKLKEYKTTLINSVVTGKVKVSHNLSDTVAKNSAI